MKVEPQNISTTRKRAVGYIRVSDEKQNLKYGPKAQLEDIQNYCVEQGYELLHVYYDAITGIVWRERPGLTKLRNAAREQDAEGKGDFEVAIVGRFDRLAREDEIQTVIMEDLAYHRVKTESATEKIEDSPAGRFMLHVYGFMAAEDRKRILKRTDDGRRARARDGKLLGSSEPKYGYKWNAERTAYLINDDVLKVDADGFSWTEAEIVKFAFSMSRSGWTIHKIRFYVQNLGIPTRRGNVHWQDSTISKILGCEYYIGEATVYQNKYESQKNSHGNKSRIRIFKRPKEEQIKMPEGVVPALIDRETFEIVQVQKLRNQQLSQRNNAKSEVAEDALLRCGLIYCGYCNYTMSVSRSSVKRAHGRVKRLDYICCVASKRYGGCQGARITGSIVDNEAWQYAVKVIRNPSLVNQALDAQKQTDDTGNDLSPVDRSIAEVERKAKSYQRALDRAIESDAEGEVVDDIIAKLDQLAKSKRVLEKEKKTILSKSEDIAEEERAIEKFRQWCAEIREKLDDPTYIPTYEEKRRACERLGIKAKVWRSDHSPRIEITARPTDIESIASYPHKAQLHKEAETIHVRATGADP